MQEGRRLIRFRGAMYAQVCGLGDDCAFLTPDDVGVILSEQYFNKGKTTPERLKDKWVQSDRYVLTQIYPSMLELGVFRGKTGTTFSTGLPLIIDDDFHGISERRCGVTPKFLTLDGQNRVVMLRQTAPRQKYPAYVGTKILPEVERITDEMEEQIQEVEDTLRAYKEDPTPGVMSRLQYFFDRGLVTQDEFPEAARRAADTLVYQGSVYRRVELAVSDNRGD